MFFPRGALTAITLCGPAVECSACGVLPPVREQFSPCDVHAHTAIGQRCLAASICWRAISSLVRHRILARPSSPTHVCSNAAADPSHHVVSSARCSRTRRIFWPTCPTLFALPFPLCMVLLSPRSVGQWNTSAQMPIRVSQICREILAPWPLERCTCGETQSVSVQWHSCLAGKADLFVLLLIFSQGCSQASADARLPGSVSIRELFDESLFYFD